MPSGTFLRRPAVLLALCLCSVGAVVTLLGRLATGPAVALKRIELNSEPGAKAYPAFSPDGSRLAYSSRGTASKDDAFHLTVRDMPNGEPRQLTQGAANDVSPAWSPDGTKLAFVRVSEEGTECVVIPVASPNEEKKYAGCSAPTDQTQGQPLPSLSWAGGGKSLIIVQTVEGQAPALATLSLDNASIQTITHPPTGSEGDSTPAVSPDGGTVAFVRANANSGADIYICEMNGANPRAVTFDGKPIHGLSWTRDGQDLVYTGARAGPYRIWRVPAYGGSPHDFAPAGRISGYAAVAPAGNRMVHTVSPTVSSIWRSPLGKQTSSAEAHAVIRTSGQETSPRYSPDGKKIADISDQTGNDEIWVCDADGSNRVQLTHLNGPNLARIRWSHDSKLLIFDADTDHGNDLYTVPAAGGKVSTVQIGAMNGSFSHDGKSVYYQSRNRIWKASIDGGSPTQVSEMLGAAQPVESADGKLIYFRSRRNIWVAPVAGGEAQEAFVPEHDLQFATTLQVMNSGVYYMEFERSAREMVVSFYDFATKKSEVVFRLHNSDFGNTSYSISPDGKTIIYPRLDQSQTNLVVYENFR